MVPKHLKTKFKSYPVFQQKVWAACAQIPAGQTRTYSWIAQQIGNPKATRAVGTALGKNPFAPVIPCHRVLRTDGSMGGYSGRGGVKTKRALLLKEGALKK